MYNPDYRLSTGNVAFISLFDTLPGYANPNVVRGESRGPDLAGVIRDKKKLLNRVRRIRGQIEAVEKALEGEQDCAVIMQTIAACRGAIHSLMAEVVEGHIRCPCRRSGSQSAVGKGPRRPGVD